jgi:phospholipase C
MTGGGNGARIQHVFVLMLENRSFDHMLGFSGITGTDAQTRAPTKVDGLTGEESNTYDGTPYRVSYPADWKMPTGPGHEFLDVLEQLAGVGATYPPGGPYPAINDSGYAANYVKNHGADPTELMKCYSPDQLPVLTTLAEEFAVCDSWCASMPGPTWPNRFFAHGASSSGLDDSPTATEVFEWMTFDGFRYQHGSIFDLLGAHDRTWRIYAGDLFPQVGALHGIDVLWDITPYADFAGDVVSDDYTTAYTWIEPNYGHITSDYTCGTSQHPLDDVTRGERLIKCTYEALRASPLWAKSLLVITWDEHGGFYDHGIPPRAVPPGDTPPRDYSTHGFAFDQLGPRVPAVVVSPLVARNTIDHRVYDHSSIPKTVEDVFGLASLTNRDAAARSASGLATLDSPRIDTPETLPDPADSCATGCPPVPPCGPQAHTALAMDPRLAEEVPPATRPEEPIDGEPNLPGVLYVAHLRDIAVTPPPERPAREARFEAVRTRGEARDYLEEVRRRSLAVDPRADRG